MATATATRPPVNVRRDFKIFTKALKAYTIVVKDAEGNEQTEHYLEAPASSTVVDRMGDVMAMSAQKKMEAAVKSRSRSSALAKNPRSWRRTTRCKALASILSFASDAMCKTTA